MITKHLITATTIVFLAQPVFAAGGDGPAQPTTNSGTKTCLFGKVYDAETKKCVKPDKSNLSMDQIIDEVRNLAYEGRYEHAQSILAVLPDQQDDRVLAYWGFTTRKMGDVEGGMKYYTAALEINPDNILVRSYMGQSFVETGDLTAAKDQLQEIRMRGGTGTWAERSLAQAIETGETYNS